MPQLIETPDGLIEFPSEMSQQQIEMVLTAQYKKDMQPKSAAAMPTNPRERGSTVGTTQQSEDPSWLARNLDFPVGIAGSVAGGILGAPLGPAGVAAGAVIGGSLGTFTGSVASDLLTEDEVSLANATRDAAISAGLDVALLGLGKVVKPAVAPLIKKAFGEGKTPEQIVKELAEKAGVPAAGTKESLAQTQKFLSERGATLTPLQTNAEGFPVLAEKVARVSLLSGGKIENNIQQVNQIISKELSDLVDLNSVNYALDSDSLGRAAFDIISQGKTAVSDEYVKSMSDVVSNIGMESVPFKPIKDAVDSFVTSYEKEGIGNVLSDEALSFVDSFTKRLSGTDKMAVPVTSLIELDKLITKEVSSFSDVRNAKFNSAASRELTELSKSLKNTIGTLLENVSPESAAKYAAAKKAYSEGIDGVLPKINETFVNQANKDKFDSLGKLMGGSGSISQVAALKKSLAVAFNKAGANTTVSKADADKLVKRAYLETMFPNFPSGSFDASSYASLAVKTQKPNELKKMKMILGDDFPAFKKLLNVMSDTAINPGTRTGEFILRGQEYKTLANVLQLGGAGVGGSLGPAGWAGAGLMLTVPRVLANIATNPKTTNRLIAISQGNYKNPEQAQAALVALLGDFWNTLEEDEKQKVIESVFELGQQEQQ